jgi:hypothetical protein
VPEAQEGGPIALVQDGDEITIDAEARQLDITSVSASELEARRAKWTAPPLKVSKGTLYKYAKYDLFPCLLFPPLSVFLYFLFFLLLFLSYEGKPFFLEDARDGYPFLFVTHPHTRPYACTRVFYPTTTGSIVANVSSYLFDTLQFLLGWCKTRATVALPMPEVHVFFCYHSPATTFFLFFSLFSSLFFPHFL